MGFEAKVLADSLHPMCANERLVREPGMRLTTMELTYPRIIHSEFMTHRQFSRNAASSRAIPIEKMLRNVMEHPFIPIEWGSNKPGMQAGATVEDPGVCKTIWLNARDAAVEHARHLDALGLHKQTVNRIVEPWMWITVIATGVDHAWENFFKLRCHPDAEPHIQRIAYLARGIFDAHQPTILTTGWHTPLVGFPGDETLAYSDIIKVSVARCARVSYLTHAGTRDVAADMKLYDRLAASGHWSPFEHVARPTEGKEMGYSNLGQYWIQHRKEFLTEYCRRAPREDRFSQRDPEKKYFTPK